MASRSPEIRTGHRLHSVFRGGTFSRRSLPFARDYQRRRSRFEIMRFRQFLFLFFLFTIAVSAQSPSKVLKQAEKAMGGAKAIQRTSSWIRKGTIRRVDDG